MVAGSLAFVLHGHLPYVRSRHRGSLEEDWFFQALTESYLPLIEMLQRALQHFDEGEIALGEGLEKPVFLQRASVAAADVRQMAVKHKCQRAGNHEPLSSAEVYGDFLEERPRGLE